MTAERMQHLYKWECQNGHEYEWEADEERLDRNMRAVNDLVCKFEGCGRVCRSKAGLTMHQKGCTGQRRNVRGFSVKDARLCWRLKERE